MGSQGNPIKVMVTGASGMLGRSLCRCLAQYPDDFVVVPLGFSRAVPPMRKVDLTDTAALRTLFSEVQPDVLVHTAAERDPDRAAKDPTRLDHLNVRAPLLLAEECAKCGAHLAYISTDYVFDGGISTGSYPPYSPDAPTAPVNVYGQSKLDGEKAVLAIPGCFPLVLRVPVLYALDCKELSESASLLVSSVLLPEARTTPQKVDDWGIRYPTLVDDVASVLKLIIEAKAKKRDSLPPILHCSSPTQITKYQLVDVMAAALGVKADHVTADPEPPKGAPRPKMTTLDCTGTWEALGVQHSFVPLREGIAKALTAHREKFASA